ncbi:MAG: phosphoribosylamine--glycine ligase [Candidatus Kerfeldbacteria bacterium]|nr:phosphoribosylamine--glycine ligase [Candidatus Kerfeldbacteria bacterium]
MHIAIIGTGAREHAIAWKLSLDPTVQLFNFGPTHNPGIAGLCQAVGIGDVTDVTAVLQWCQEQKIDIAWIGPEAPLAAGVVNALEAFGIACIGPTQQMARLESSKSFTRELLDKYEIQASPSYRVFTSMDGVADYMWSLQDDVVIKPDGLTGGKGVRVMGAQLKTREDAMAYCSELFAEGAKRIVIEEKLVGQEFSLMSFSDGKHLVHMPAVQDHKRAYVGDAGPNTGGMGSYTDANHSLPFLNEHDVIFARQINEQTLYAIQEECGEEYKGIIYGGFIAVRGGVRLIEYNARFGDPEVMNMLSLLKTSLVDITKAIAERTLDQLHVEFAPLASVCKYVVPQGYPDKPVRGEPIDITQVDQAKVQLFYGAVDQTEGGLVLTGSRAVGLVATGTTIAEAEQVVEQEIKKITGPVFHREDIGTAALIDERITMLRNLRHA